MTTAQPACDSFFEDNQTLALIRRVLCPQAPLNTPLDQILPALTSSPSVDFQLYAFLAIICRDFLFSWYSKITNDRVFVDEVIQVIAHTTRSLEERFRQVDLEVLLLDEVSELFNNHVHDFRQCINRHKTALSPHLSFSDTFHNLQPHPALKGSLDDEKLYLKLLSSGVLALLLPTEDLQSDCERTLVREIVSDLIFWNVVDKLSEPFLLYEILTKIVAALRDAGDSSLPSSPPQVVKDIPKSLAADSDEGRKRRKGRKQRGDSRLLPKSPTLTSSSSLGNASSSGWSSKQCSRLLVFAANLLSILITITSLLTSTLSTIVTVYQNPPPPLKRKQPILRMSILKLVSSLLQLDSRQPWLKGNISLALSPLTSRPAGSLVDITLSYLFQKHVAKNEKILVQSLRLAREALFPNGTLAPARKRPTPGEERLVRETCEKRMLELMPDVLKNHYFGNTVEQHLAGLGEYLDIMQDKRINKHVVYQTMDLVLLRLMPELAENVPSELMGERLPGNIRKGEVGEGEVRADH